MHCSVSPGFTGLPLIGATSAAYAFFYSWQNYSDTDSEMK